MTNEKKQRKKINPLDVVIILLVLCLVATFAYRLYDGVTTPNLKDDSEFVVYFDCNDYKSLTSYIDDEDGVYLASTGELFGYVCPVNESGAIVNIKSNESGTTTLPVTDYEKVDFSGALKLSAEARAVSSGNYYSLGEMNFTKGSTVEVYTEKAVFTITVTDIVPIQ